MSCPSAASCTGVGSYVNSYNRQETLAEQWNGTSWATPATPNPSGVVDSSLTGVSCASTGACTAVGNGLGSSDTDVTLAGQWNGTGWVFQTVPAPAYSSLSGVSCTADNACTAVGSSGGGPLAEAWNGAAWTIQTTATSGPALSGVSCPATNFCIAVGGSLAERWNGTTWTVQTTATPSGGVLAGVSCASATVCTAVGNYVNGSGVNVTLAERWNGTAWTVKTTPNPAGATSSTLSAVSCTAVNACTAVGNYINPSGTHLTLAEQWNGTTWTIQTSPNPNGATYSALSGVSCITATACTAVGDYVNASGTDVTLAETYT